MTHDYISISNMITKNKGQKPGYESLDFLSYLLDLWRWEKYESGLEVLHEKVSVSESISTIYTKLKEDFFFFQVDGKHAVAIASDNNILLELTNRNKNVDIEIYGDVDKIKECGERLNKILDINPCVIKWIYDPQYMEFMIVPVSHKQLPMEEMYPFLKGETLASYYDRFMNSNENILVLLGPPGTGKTTFIRGLLAHSRKSASLAYHEKILEQDSFFADWISGEDTFMILEDSDKFLLPREDGNNMMSRFLNIGDGLMTFSQKKLIFSTNLPHINNIDSALTRPGRCFDLLTFDSLNYPDADLLAKKIGVDLPDGNSFTISEIFNEKRNETQKQRRSFGFV